MSIFVRSSTSVAYPNEEINAMFDEVNSFVDREISTNDKFSLTNKSVNLYYRSVNTKEWQDKVRHLLFSTSLFIKDGRRTPNGFYRIIHPACLQQFISGNFNRATARRAVREFETVNKT